MFMCISELHNISCSSNFVCRASSWRDDWLKRLTRLTTPRSFHFFLIFAQSTTMMRHKLGHKLSWQSNAHFRMNHDGPQFLNKTKMFWVATACHSFFAVSSWTASCLLPQFSLLSFQEILLPHVLKPDYHHFFKSQESMIRNTSFGKQQLLLWMKQIEMKSWFILFCDHFVAWWRWMSGRQRNANCNVDPVKICFLFCFAFFPLYSQMFFTACKHNKQSTWNNSG